VRPAAGFSVPSRGIADHNLLVSTKAARTVACGFVVLVHINLYIRHGMGLWWPGGFGLAPFFAVPVPTFFLLSGFFAGRFSPSVTRPGIRSFMRKKLRVLIIPFLIWNAILLLLDGQSRQISPGEILYYSLTGYWQLYYISVLLQLLLLYYVLEPYLKGRGVYLFFGISALLACGFALLADTFLWTKGASSAFLETHMISSFPPWVVFFASGVWLRHSPKYFYLLVDNIRWLFILTALSFALYYWELRLEDAWLGFNPLQQFLAGGLPFRFLCPLLLLAALYKVKESGHAQRIRLWLASASEDTYGIYLSHTTVIILLFGVWQASGYGIVHWVEVPILWIATWFLCQGGVRLASSMKLRWIGVLFFGTVRRA